MTRCPSCNNMYQRIGSHFQRSDCQYPDLADKQKRIITGLVMGDASISGSNSSTSSNPYMQIEMVNSKFLEWVSDELGIYSNGCKLVNTASEQASRNGSDGEYQDVYKLTTMRSPVFERWAKWYSSGKKQFGEFTVDPVTMGVWYVCDGWKNEQSQGGRPYACISSVNESDRKERLLRSLRSNGFECSWIRNSIRMTADSSEFFWEWAEQPPGFEYKWP